MPRMTVRDLTEIRRKRVLMRVDFNVPLDDKGNVTDDTRIRETLPTIEYLRERGAITVLMSHLGRPDGQKVPALSLRPVAARLAELLHQSIAFLDDCIGEKVEKTVAIAQPGDVLLLENVRFYAEEEANDPQFAAKLSRNGDLYANDAFGTAHRAHASTVGVTKFLSPCVAGFLMEKELKYLGEELANPARPFVVILGGAKVSDKIGVIENLLKKADAILIGGAMAYSFLKAQGVAMGGSRVEDDKLDVARRALEQARARNVKILLPEDHLVARAVKTDKLDKKGKAIVEFRDAKNTATNTIEDGWAGVDIGPRTIEAYKAVIQSAKTIVWNGPMGIFENPDFARGTFGVAEAVARATGGGAKSIIGGGDSVTAVKKAKVADKMTFISTGGGASLEFLEGKKLPGVEALSNK